MNKQELIKKFESQFEVPVYAKISFFTQHPNLLALSLFTSITLIIFFFVCIVIAFEDFLQIYADLLPYLAIGMAIFIPIIVILFKKQIVSRVARFAPEGAIALLKPLKNKIIKITIKNRLVSAELKHPLTKRVDVLCVYQTGITSLEGWEEFYVNLHLTKPLDKTKIEIKVEKLKKQWKGFGIKFRNNKILEFFGVTGTEAGYSLNQVLPEIMNIISK